MSSSVAELAERTSAMAPFSGLASRLARKLVLEKLKNLPVGCLEMRLEDGTEILCGKSGSEPRARIQVEDAAFYPRVAFGGAIGAAESFMDGHWAAEDLTAVIRLLLGNRAQLESLSSGWGRLVRPLHLLFHRLRENTRIGSRRNIEAHYDLGNDFYELFLDKSMMYSSAIYEHSDMTLEAASEAKLERICHKLNLQASDHILEIGTGWGGFAIHAAGRYGCRVTTTTISPSQARYARERVCTAGLEDRIEIVEQDYRDLGGTYDKLVSIEMIEAVGLAHLDGFFRVCAARLKDDGVMVLQAITIADRFFERAKRSVDFIQRYIFPGSALPSVGGLYASIGRTDLQAVHMEDIGPHYATTLATWRRRFLANREEVLRQGFSERFVRMWHYYFSYCEGGFLERSIGDVQLVLTKPMARPGSLLGGLSARG
jgi:cyclopropane-fatty-acyl-phospholipid synthase